MNGLGYYVTVEVPSRVKSYKKSCGFNSRNDKIDATALAYMGLERNLRKWEPINSFYYELRTLTRYYESVQQMHTSACNQLHAMQVAMHRSKLVVKQLKANIQLYEKQLAELEKAIEEKIESEPQVKRKIDNMYNMQVTMLLKINQRKEEEKLKSQRKVMHISDELYTFLLLTWLHTM